jgi:hypothetical protein
MNTVPIILRSPHKKRNEGNMGQGVYHVWSCRRHLPERVIYATK